MTDQSYSPDDAQVRAVGRYVLAYATLIDALRWRIQVMASRQDVPVPDGDLLKAFSTLTRQYKDDLRIDALLESLETELTAAFATREAQAPGDWFTGYARIDPDLGLEARQQPTLKHLGVDELNAAADRFEALERVFRMWMHAISPLTGDLGASPYFKIVDGQVRC
ncbi:hypothetical protein [Cryptosporangium phraense]|uniref:Uncharacterized protein n=1 Tax=Cryptosporangium phraense TaxID=2593070 RepID=A0A545AXE8_9ACTN|nr:hypothetical protein [Cryptosporangium phraense]TQS46006.1 hypothetical protein FL583_05820 [Cryptosporangium phraense]